MLVRIKTIIKELFTPSNKSGPAHESYDRSAQGVYHMVLGAGLCFASIFLTFPFHPFITPLIIALLYYSKEIIDLKNDGNFADGLEDTICVFVGAFAYSLAYWPVIFLAIGIALFIGTVK